MANKTDIKTLEKAEELTEFELQQIEAGSKTTSARKEGNEEGIKKRPVSNMEEGNKKQIVSPSREHAEISKKT